MLTPAASPLLAASAPAITITAPLTNQVVTGSTVTVAARAADATSASFLIDGGPSGSLTYDAASAQWMATVDASQISAGTHNVTVSAVIAGVASKDTAWRVTFSGTATTPTSVVQPAKPGPIGTSGAPAITIQNPLSNQSYHGTIDVQAVATNAASVAYVIDTGSPVPMSFALLAGVWRATLDTTTLPNGSHTFDVVATNASGATARDRAWSVSINNSASPTPARPQPTSTPGPTSPAGPPTVLIQGPLTGQTVTAGITVIASATNAVGLAYAVDGGTANPMSFDAGSGTWRAALNTATVPNGVHNVDVINTGAAGVVATDRAWSVTFTNTVGATPTATVPALSPTPVSPLVHAWGVNYAGGEFSPSTLPGTMGSTYIYPTDASRASYFAGKGMRLVRLPILWERVQPRAFGALSSSDVAAIRSAMDVAGAAGQQVIIDLHNYGRYNGAALTVADAPKLANLWKQLAAALRDHPALYGYELMNEPHDLPEGGPGWAAMAQTALDGLRQADSNAWVLVPGYGWQTASFWASNNPTLAIHDNANHFQYAAHLYFDADYSGTYSTSYDASGAYPAIGVDRAQPFLTWLAGQGAPGMFTEYGVPDNDARWLTVLDNFMSALSRAPNITGGTYWAAGPWWGNYPLSVEPSNGADRPQMSVLAKYRAS